MIEICGCFGIVHRKLFVICCDFYVSVFNTCNAVSGSMEAENDDDMIESYNFLFNISQIIFAQCGFNYECVQWGVVTTWFFFFPTAHVATRSKTNQCTWTWCVVNLCSWMRYHTHTFMFYMWQNLSIIAVNLCRTHRKSISIWIHQQQPLKTIVDTFS